MQPAAANEIKDVVRSLTQGSPDEQQDAIYRYFAPGATFEHPFCRVPSFKDLHVPGVGEFDSRALITAIFRWCKSAPADSHSQTLTLSHPSDKIMSPKIDLEIESCGMSPSQIDPATEKPTNPPSPALDEQTSTLYLHIFQVFSIWFLPFYRAPVRLVSVLHLTPAPLNTGEGTPPPPYDAAQEKRHAVQEGAEPSYAAVASTSSTSTAAGLAQQQQQQQGRRKSAQTGPKRYLIQKQQDLYQTTEFVKFVSLAPGSAVAGFLQLLATLFCLVASVVLSPVVKAVWPVKGGKGGENGNGKEKRV